MSPKGSIAEYVFPEKKKCRKAKQAALWLLKFSNLLDSIVQQQLTLSSKHAKGLVTTQVCALQMRIDRQALQAVQKGW